MLRPNDPASISLKHRIVAGVLAAACLVWVLLSYTMYRAVLNASAVEFDERLAQQAEIIQVYAEHEYAETRSVLDNVIRQPVSGPHSGVVYQIWTIEGQLLYRSAGAPSLPLMEITAQGFGDVRLESKQWRAYIARSRLSPLVVEVAELTDHRRLIATRVLFAVMIPVLLALPLLALLVYGLTHRAMKPILRFADDISRREAGDLSRLDLAQLPAETQALGVALNDLIDRYGAALDRESRFTGDAAHELRTPLAAVRAQAQVALRARNPEEISTALTRLIGGVDRANRLVGQLLSLSRLEHGNHGTPLRMQRLSAVIDAALHDLASLAQTRHVIIQNPAVPEVSVPEETAYLLLRNLLDNAIRHSPPAGIVRVTTTCSDDQLCIQISDQGPGLPADLRQRVLERFFRHEPSYEGSGLGLSIVARVVDLWGGQMQFEETGQGRGLKVTILVPLRKFLEHENTRGGVSPDAGASRQCAAGLSAKQGPFPGTSA